MELSKQIATDLLKIKAVQINPNEYYTWTSGIQSPIYCDNRLTMSYPKVRKKISEGFIELIKESKMDAQVIAGCATAGIPHAAWLSEVLDLPMVYVRSKPKGHGKQNQIEGSIQPGRKVVVIEDLISTGGSAIKSAEALTEVGAEVVGMLAIFSYGLNEAKDSFKQAGYPYQTITNFDILLETLVEKGELTAKEQESMLRWREGLSLSER